MSQFPSPAAGQHSVTLLELLRNFLSTLWKLLAFRNGQADLNQKLDKIQNCNNNKKQFRNRIKPSR